jgi:hypothetical protein
MRFFHHKPARPRPDFDTSELRRAADRLTGWKWTGDGPLDPPILLRDASYEIDRLQRLLAAGSQPVNEEGK